MHEKKENIYKGLVIFLLFCFGFTWLYDFVVIRNIAVVNDERLISILNSCGMYFPLIAHLFTRLILKEGLSLSWHESLMLGINRKYIIWMFFAAIIPFVYTEIGNWILVAVYPNILLSENLRMALGITASSVFLKVIKKIVMALAFSLVAIGEESGFRGYMMPRLMQIMSIRKAIIVGGVIWGVWHIPLICMGYNFGTDYNGFPYVGIAMMILNCIFAGCILTMITIRTESIWPATLMHAFNNSRPSIISYNFNTYEVSRINPIHLAFILQIPIYILGIICFYHLKNSRDYSYSEII